MASSLITVPKFSLFPSFSSKSPSFPPSSSLQFRSSPLNFPSLFSKSLLKSSIVSCSLNPNLSHARRPDYIPNHIPDPNYVRIFDTTLRDGKQSPGATLTSKMKLDIARQLAKLGVDIIEAGFPAASPDDFKAVKSIAKEVGVDKSPIHKTAQPNLNITFGAKATPIN